MSMPDTKLIKTTILSVLLLLQTFLLTQTIIAYVQTQEYFTPPLEISIKIVVLLWTIAITMALTIGMWGKWKQYVFITVPVALAIFVSLIRYNFGNAAVISLGAGAVVCYGVYKSTHLGKLLLRIQPKYMLRYTVKWTLLVLSLLGSAVLILNSTYRPIEFNLGQKISEVAANPIQKITDTPYSQYLQYANINVQDLVEQQVNDFVEPYKDFVPPLVALLIFGVFQLYTTIAYVLYVLTVDLVFMVAKKTGFLKTETITVEKETLSF
jgi:hypothetical protein